MSIISGALGAAGANKAAAADEKASRLDYLTAQQAREDLAPWRNAGGAAVNQLSALLGLGYLPQQARMSNLLLEKGYDPFDDRLWQTPAWTGYGGAGVLLDANGNPVTGSFQGNPGSGTGQGDQVNITGTTGLGLNGYGTGAVGASGSGTPTTGDPRAANQADAFSYFTTSPDYQFRLDEGLKAVDRSAAARGLLQSGAQIKAVNNYAQNTASGEYGNYVNRLLSLAGLGQTSASTGGQIVANGGQAAGQQVANAGQARASAYSQLGQGIGGFLSGAANLAGYGFGAGWFGGGGYPGGAARALA